MIGWIKIKIDVDETNCVAKFAIHDLGNCYNRLKVISNLTWSTNLNFLITFLSIDVKHSNFISEVHFNVTRFASNKDDFEIKFLCGSQEEVVIKNSVWLMANDW